MKQSQSADTLRLLEAVPEALVVVDDAGRIVQMNSRAGEMFGYSRGELLGQLVEILMPHGSRDGHAAHRARYTGEPGTRPMGGKKELSGRRKDGREFPVDIMLTPWADNGEKLVLASIRDMSLRMQAEQELRARIEEDLGRSEQRYRALVENSDDMVCELDLQGRYFYASPNTAGTLGYEPTELLGTCAFDKVHPDDLPQVTAKFGLSSAMASFRFRHKDGSWRWVESAGRTYTTPAGETRAVIFSRDITARRHTEAVLREGEEQFRAMFEVASIGMAQADTRTGQLLRVNQKLCAITGYSADEMLRMRFPEITHPDDRQADWEAFQRVVRGEAPEYRVEKRYVRKNGSIAWVNVNMTVISAAAGQSARTIATIEDISERKRAEEALRESEERFRNIFEHAGMGISIAHLDGRFVQCNPAFCGITGYSMEELSGMEFSSLLHPGDREENMRLIRELVDREIPSFGIENRYISKTGETVWVRKFSTILRNDEGYPTHLLSLVTDITSRMRKNAALQRQAELLHLSHDAIFVWNTESGIEYWNKGATDLYGFHASEIRGRVSRELLKAGFPVPWPQIEAELRERGCWEGEVRHTTKAGGEVIVASRLQLVPDGGGSLLVLETNRDITDRRRLEREILEISESERRNFGQELHDDLGQQLTGVMMMSGILADDLRKKSPRQADDLEELVRLLKHAMHSARRMAKGLYPTELRDGDLVLAIEGLANTVAATSGIPCELRYDPAFHFKNPDAAIHLYRIVQEALNNAVRHGGASRIAVECSASPERLTITVTNDGRHFTHPPKESHGMGLSLMEHRAHLLGGELAFRPLKTGGCEVICSIPAKQSDAS